MQIEVSIVIVNYNTYRLIQNCLKSVYEQTKDIDFEVIVSDNGSIDGSIEMIKQEFPQVILIENNANLGFGAANNRGLKLAKGKYIFYLNSDTILLNNAVKAFYDFWEKSSEKDKIGALGANLLNGEGEITHSYGRFPRVWNEIRMMIRRIIITDIKLILKLLCIDYRKYKNKVVYSKHIGEVEYITGADLFVKNNDFAYYDERFFLYYEETNMQWQMMKNGLKRLIIDGPQIIHLEGGSDKKTKDGNIEDYISFGTIQSDLSRIKFFKYNVSYFYSRVLKVLLFLFWVKPGLYKKTKLYRNKLRNL